MVREIIGEVEGRASFARVEDGNSYGHGGEREWLERRSLETV